MHQGRRGILTGSSRAMERVNNRRHRIRWMAMTPPAGTWPALSFEQSSQFISQMTLSVQQLKEGTGPLFDALARLDTGLLEQGGAGGASLCPIGGGGGAGVSSTSKAR